MRLKLFWIGLGISGLFMATTMLAQTTGPATATAPSTVPAASAPATTRAATSTAPSAAPTCTPCHAWDKVITASAAYKLPNGKGVNPHTYIPHTSTNAEDIPDCLHCHTTHATDTLPKAGDIDLKNVTVKWCYDACHHKKNFTPCTKCH